MEWAPINERIIRARFYSRFAKTTVLQTYAPTNEVCEEEKEDFYEQLQCEIEKTPKHDILLLMGDVNSKVGTANEQWKGTIATEGIVVMNENGERVLEFCAINDLVIGGTLFKHKDIHKFTWESPKHRDRNQIDHIAINGRYRRSLLDTKAMRGADVGSDHHLVIAKLRLKLTRYRVAGAGRRLTYDTVRLKSPVPTDR